MALITSTKQFPACMPTIAGQYLHAVQPILGIVSVRMCWTTVSIQCTEFAGTNLLQIL